MVGAKINVKTNFSQQTAYAQGNGVSGKGEISSQLGRLPLGLMDEDVNIETDIG